MAKPRGPINNPFAPARDAEKEKDVLSMIYETPVLEPVQKEGLELQPDTDATDAPVTAYGMERASNVVLIPWDLIDPDENNFFSQTEIEVLAENIAEIGLQHNCVVRPTEGGRFKLISGHRRWTACKYLSELGNHNFDKVLCQVKEVDAVDGEIMLIYDNQQTRTVTPIERIKSVERLTDLIAEKRKRGEVKGKTRDLVGQIIGMSGIEVQRIQQVRTNLLPDLMNALDKGVITFRAAIDLSGKPKEVQEQVAKRVASAEVLSTNEVAKISQRIEVKGEQLDKTNHDKAQMAFAAKWLKDMEKTVQGIHKHSAEYARMREEAAPVVEALQEDAVKVCCSLSLAWYDLVRALGADKIEYLLADTLETQTTRQEPFEIVEGNKEPFEIVEGNEEPVAEETDAAVRLMRHFLGLYREQQERVVDA